MNKRISCLLGKHKYSTPSVFGVTPCIYCENKPVETIMILFISWLVFGNYKSSIAKDQDEQWNNFMRTEKR